jgi:hypothetical protein
MKLSVVFLVLGCLIPPVSAGKTKYTIVMDGEWVSDWNGDGVVRSLLVKLVAKVYPDGLGGLEGTAWIAVIFTLPDGTKITYRHKGQIWFEPEVGDEDVMYCFIDINGDGMITPTDVLKFQKVEGTNLWEASKSVNIKGHTGTLNLRIGSGQSKKGLIRGS